MLLATHSPVPIRWDVTAYPAGGGRLCEHRRMRLYAQTATRRSSQVLGDLGLVVWCAVWIMVARFVHGLVAALAGPGRSLEAAGQDLASSMQEAAEAAGSVPVAGDALRAPFELARNVGTTLQDAGTSQQEAVATLAFWLAFVLAAIPIAWALVRVVPARLRWVREAAAARVVIDDMELFALRALQRRPLRQLATVGPAPATAWKAGDPTVTTALAALELRSLGLRLPPAAGRSGQPMRRPTSA